MTKTSNRRNWKHLLICTLAIAACGDDGGSQAGPPDAAVDAQPTTDAGATQSPYQLVTCGSPADAPDAGLSDADASVPDAGLSDADAGINEPPALGDPCCDPDNPCPGGLACIEGPDGNRTCSERCDTELDPCQYGGICASFGGSDVCIPASTEGQDCAPELCDSATICTGESADDAVCKRKCEAQEECDEGTTCTGISGTDSRACL